MVLSIDKLLADANNEQESIEIIEKQIMIRRVAINSELEDLESKLYIKQKIHKEDILQSYKVLEEVDYLLQFVKSLIL